MTGVDFPTVALTQAEWDAEAQQMHLALDPMNDSVVGRPTSLIVSGLDDPTVFAVRSPDGVPVDVDIRGPDLVLHTQVARHSLCVAQG